MADYTSQYTGSEIDDRLGKAGKAVLTDEQTLTDGQKSQARTNIGAIQNPSGGSAGQVLKKTASGVEWGDGVKSPKKYVISRRIPKTNFKDGVSYFVRKVNGKHFVHICSDDNYDGSWVSSPAIFGILNCLVEKGVTNIQFHNGNFVVLAERGEQSWNTYFNEQEKLIRFSTTSLAERQNFYLTYDFSDGSKVGTIISRNGDTYNVEFVEKSFCGKTTTPYVDIINGKIVCTKPLLAIPTEFERKGFSFDIYGGKFTYKYFRNGKYPIRSGVIATVSRYGKRWVSKSKASDYPKYLAGKISASHGATRDICPSNVTRYWTKYRLYAIAKKRFRSIVYTELSLRGKYAE